MALLLYFDYVYVVGTGGGFLPLLLRLCPTEPYTIELHQDIPGSMREGRLKTLVCEDSREELDDRL